MFDQLPFALSLGSDNHSGIHPKVLEAITAANRGHAHAYGGDELSACTDKEMRRVFGPEARAFYVFNGTAANVLSLKLFLQGYESALVSDVAHMYMDECGAPEALAGIKLLPVPSYNGKITPTAMELYLVRKGDQHYAQPRMLSLTQPTEMGTLYLLEEMKALIACAHQHHLFVHVDGARLIHAAHRLGKGLREITFDLGVDVISFGGTKNGLLGGEAVVVREKSRAQALHYYRKQYLQLPSKSRFLAAQFYAFLKDDLWQEIAAHACAMADLLGEKLKAFPEVQILAPVESNAVFVQVPKEWVKPLREKFFFYVWDELTGSLRWMISFDITARHIEDFVAHIARLKEEKHGKDVGRL